MVIWWSKLSSYQIPFLTRIEKLSKRLITKLQTFNKDKIRFNIIWNTRTMEYLFKNKNKVQHLRRVISRGVCFCGVNYIGEAIGNVNKRRNEHERGIDKNPECFKNKEQELEHLRTSTRTSTRTFQSWYSVVVIISSSQEHS